MKNQGRRLKKGEKYRKKQSRREDEDTIKRETERHEGGKAKMIKDKDKGMM